MYFGHVNLLIKPLSTGWNFFTKKYPPAENRQVESRLPLFCLLYSIPRGLHDGRSAAQAYRFNTTTHSITKE
jgi:hypothetical protein